MGMIHWDQNGNLLICLSWNGKDNELEVTTLPQRMAHSVVLVDDSIVEFVDPLSHGVCEFVDIHSKLQRRKHQ